MVSGCYHFSILLLRVPVPHRSQSPSHQRHRLFLGMVQRVVHFRHLWGGQLVLTIRICKVLQPGCPCLAGKSPFCLSSNLMGSLDQHFSSPSFAWSVHTKWTPSITYGTTSRPWITLMAHPVEEYFLYFPIQCRNSTQYSFPYLREQRLWTEYIFLVCKSSKFIHT